MEYKTIRGKNSSVVDMQVNIYLNQGWEIVTETDSRATHRKFSLGKSLTGGVLFGGVGLLAGAIGKDKKSGEVTVRLQRERPEGEKTKPTTYMERLQARVDKQNAKREAKDGHKNN